MYKCPVVAGVLYLHGTTKMCVWLGYRYQRQGKMRLNPGKQHIPGVLQTLYGISIILVAQEVTEEFKVEEYHNQISTLKKLTLAIK